MVGLASSQYRAEQGAAADCLQRTLLRRSRFRQRLNSGVRRLPCTSVINFCLQGEERDTHDRDKRP
jgi:hypothetical protein